MIADGATTISEIDTLRHQGELFGSVASDTTVWRALEEITPARLGKIATARARVRRHVWTQIETRHGGIPPARVAGRDLGEVTVIRLDASIVLAHSDKQQAGPTFKKTFGFHPLTPGVTTPTSRWSSGCGRGGPGPTPRPTTSRS